MQHLIPLAYLLQHLTPPRTYLSQFTEEPEPLTLSDKAEFLATLKGVSLASDAFFPFRDSIDLASTRGVEYVVAAGGSVADEEVIAAADHNPKPKPNPNPSPNPNPNP